MKTIFLQISLAFLLSYSAIAQTQKIAHKSHSNSAFAVDEDLKDDFGAFPWMTYREMESDSVGLREFLKTKNGKKLVKWIEKQPKDMDMQNPENDNKHEEFWNEFESLTKNWKEKYYLPFSADDFRRNLKTNYKETRKLILNNSEKGLLKYKSQGSIFENTGKVVFGIAFLCLAGWVYRESA
ncbi:MAG: hypothetical protein ACJAWV_002686 [Flammeovirgaceae bacterium]|jgi:hypothetical protein